MAWSAVFIGIGTILLLIVAVVLIARTISRPINLGLALAEDIAKGDLSRRLNLDRGDEIGKLGNALDRMADSLSQSADAAKKSPKEIWPSRSNSPPRVISLDSPCKRWSPI